MTRPIILWCLAPFVFAVFHLALGSRLRPAELASKQRELAEEMERAGRYKEAGNAYKRAKDTAHPSDLSLRARLDIDLARTAVLSGAPLEGAHHMEQLVNTLAKRRSRLAFEEDAKATRALGLYFAAYALRLDSPASEAWRHHAEASRRLFAELHDAAKSQNRNGDTFFYGRNLEATILLQRLRQAELASAPTPGPVLAALENGIAAQTISFETAP
jgi:hypothetical protein